MERKGKEKAREMMKGVAAALSKHLPLRRFRLPLPFPLPSSHSLSSRLIPPPSFLVLPAASTHSGPDDIFITSTYHSTTSSRHGIGGHGSGRGCGGNHNHHGNWNWEERGPHDNNNYNRFLLLLLFPLSPSPSLTPVTLTVTPPSYGRSLDACAKSDT